MMRIRVLGPLLINGGTQWSPIPAGQQRVVMAVLVAEAGRTVSIDRLIYDIWKDHPPRRPRTVVHGYVFRLRRLLDWSAGCPLTTNDNGYRLDVADEEIDAQVFERLVAAGRSELADMRPAAAVEQFTQALRLWREPAYADVPWCPTVSTEANRLEAARLDAIEERMRVLLELGRPAEVAAQAQRLVIEHPLREHLHEYLMLALYKCGRRDAALAGYQHARRILAAELGLEPGPRLRELHRAVLAGTQAR